MRRWKQVDDLGRIEQLVLGRLRQLRATAGEYRLQRVENKIRALLEAPGQSVYLDSEDEFAHLQSTCKPVREYGYEPFDKWRRGVTRAIELIEIADLREPGAATVEIGTGDGMTSYALSTFGHKPKAADFKDWRSDGGTTLPFMQLDVSAERLPLEDNSVDLSFSYMTFEHLFDPAFTLKEMIRVTRPGRVIHLSFGPPYASPWGLHAYRSLHMPYPQYLFSPQFIEQKLNTIGIYDLGAKLMALQPLNGWLIRQYDDLWRSCACEVISQKNIPDLTQLQTIRAYPQCFRGRDLQFEDVVTTLIEVTLKKPV
jgi:ubiquinone/menaquinone biosynthesis C-methylase UbiE